jgi:hypothetical protein
MSDAQADAVLDDYREYVAGLRPLLTDELTALLDTGIHDGQVQSYTLEGGRFVWRLLTGDLQRGYTFVTATYEDADVVGGQADLDALKLLDAGTELLYDELELLSDDRAMHRVLVWPEGEVWIRFRTVHLAQEPASPEARR